MPVGDGFCFYLPLDGKMYPLLDLRWNDNFEMVAQMRLPNGGPLVVVQGYDMTDLVRGFREAQAKFMERVYAY